MRGLCRRFKPHPHHHFLPKAKSDFESAVSGFEILTRFRQSSGPKLYSSIFNSSDVNPSTRLELLPKGLLRVDAELSRSIKDLCEIEVLDLSKRVAEGSKEALISA